MTNHFAAIAQMLMTRERIRAIPVLSMRYGDAKLGPRHVVPPENGELHRIGLTQSLLWLERTTRDRDDALEHSDRRMYGMQMICLSSMEEVRVWHDDLPDEHNPLNPEARTPESIPSPSPSPSPPPPSPRGLGHGTDRGGLTEGHSGGNALGAAP